MSSSRRGKAKLTDKIIISVLKGKDNDYARDIIDQLPDPIKSMGLGYILLCAKRKSGKSVMITSLIVSHLQHVYRNICIVSPTVNTDAAWVNFQEALKDRKPEPVYLDDCSGATFETLYTLQAKRSKEDKEETLLLVVDDSVNDTQYNRPLNNFATRGRHVMCCVIESVQNWRKMPPVRRENASAVFIFKLYSKEEIEKIWDSYGMDMTLHEFSAYLDYCWSVPFRPAHISLSHGETFRVGLE